MPIYVYETISDRERDVRRFEVRQAMSDAPLTRDPDTGLPVRRVLLGGIEIPRAPSDPRRKPSCAHGAGASCACCRPQL